MRYVGSYWDWKLLQLDARAYEDVIIAYNGEAEMNEIEASQARARGNLG